MIDVSSIINDPDFNVPFIRIPVTGAFTAGVWQVTEGAPQNMNGIVLPSKLDELKSLPEGERNAESISIYSLVQLNMGEDQETTQPDIIGYLGGWYRVSYIRYYVQCSLWYVVATRYQRATS